MGGSNFFGREILCQGEEEKANNAVMKIPFYGLNFKFSMPFK